MDNSTLALMYLKAVERDNYEDISNYGSNIFAIDGFDCADVNALKVKKDIMAYNRNSIGKWCSLKADKDSKAFMKNGSYSLIDRVLSATEKDYALYVDDACRDVLDEILGDCYETVLFCFKDNDLGKQKAAEHIRRALNSGVGKYHLRGLCSYKFIDEQTKAQITAETDRVTVIKQRQYAEEQNAIAIAKLQSVQVLDESNLEDLNDAAGRVSRICKGAVLSLPEYSEDYCIETLKQKLSKLEDEYTAEAIAALTSDNVTAQTEIIYFPIGYLKYHMSPAHYRYTYSDTYKRLTGSFDYGEGTDYDSVTMSNCPAKDVVVPYTSSGDKEVMKEGKYVKAYVPSNISMPMSLYFSDLHAQRAIVKELAVADYGMHLDKVRKEEFSYSLEAMYYSPVYSVRLSSGSYVAKGLISTRSPELGKIFEVASVEDGQYVSARIKNDEEQTKKETTVKTGGRTKKVKAARITSCLFTLASVIAMLLVALGSSSSPGMQLTKIFTPIAVVLCFIGNVTARRKPKLCMAVLVLSILCALTSVVMYVLGIIMR